MKIVELSEKNFEEIMSLLNHCTGYFKLVGGEMPSSDTANSILNDLPPEKNANDKKVFGLYEGEELIALVDFIIGYKALDEGIIGLFLIDERKRKLGIGTLVHDKIIHEAKSYGINRLRVVPVESNITALSFWKKQGYEEVERKSMTIGKKENVAIIMNRKI